MALFTDAEILTLDDLLAFEGSLVHVASTHNINVDKKVSLAKRVVSEKVTIWLQDSSLTDPQWFSRCLIGLSTVVVTPPLNKWLCFETLTRFFAEAYNVQLNTRFEGKWKEYQQEAKYASDELIQSGLGIVFKPLPKPAMPLVSIQQGVAPAEPLYVQSSWTDAQGNESALSPVNGLLVGNQSGISVQMAEGALASPPAAIGWNIYVSSDSRRLTRQNGNPLTIGSTWTLPATGIVDGKDGGDGQVPEFFVPLVRKIRRG
jgi:hypothetical protein